MEVKNRWMPGISVVSIGQQGRRVFENDGKRVVNLNRTNVIPHFLKDDKRSLRPLLNRLLKFKTEPSPTIFIA